MNAYKVNLWTAGNTSVQTATIDLGTSKTFYAWCQINMIDSRSNFDRDNAVAIEVYKVDGALTAWCVSGGDHYGASNTDANVHEGALAGYGRRITFRLRAAHTSDLDTYGTGIVLVP